MNFKKINTKKTICVLLSGFIVINVVGCSKTDSSLSNSYNQNNEVITEFKEELDNNQDNEIITESKEEDQNYSSNESNNEIEDNNAQNSTVNYSNDDETVIQTFNNLNEEINNILNSENFENAKEIAKGTFITIVDFIFYDSEINGVTFDELTDEGKQKILELANKIDTKIENKFPNYKDTISNTAKDAFNKASSLIKKGANNIKEFSKEKLGEDNYNKIIEAKNEFIFYTKNAIEIIGDFGSDIFEDGKEYIKEWYDKFKGN